MANRYSPHMAALRHKAEALGRFIQRKLMTRKWGQSSAGEVSDKPLEHLSNE